MAALARLVLDKSVLNGLKVSVWDAEGGHYEDGIIEEYSQAHSSYVVLGEVSRFAVQFHQFTVEEEEGEQLVLKVSRCARVQLPPCFSSDVQPRAATAEQGAPLALDTPGAIAGTAFTNGAARTSAAVSEHSSRQLSSVMSEQLGDLVGTCFSTTEDGFEAMISSSILSRRASATGGIQVLVGGSSECANADLAGAALPGSSPSQLLDKVAEQQIRQVGTDGEHEQQEEPHQQLWQQPELNEEPQEPDLCAAAGMPASALAPTGETTDEAATAQGKVEAAGQADVATADPEGKPPERAKAAEVAVSAAAPGAEVAGQGAWHEGVEAGTSAGEYWGTPVKNAAESTGPAAEQQQQPQLVPVAATLAATGPLGTGGLRQMVNFQEISRMISGGGEGSLAPKQQQQPGQQAPSVAAGTIDLAIAAAVAEAEVQEIWVGGIEAALPAQGSSEFVMGVAAILSDEGGPDVGPRPPSGLSSWRASRTTIDQELTGEAAMVDIPQAQHSRRASRTSARSLPVHFALPPDDSLARAPPGAGTPLTGGGGASAGPLQAMGSRRISRGGPYMRMSTGDQDNNAGEPYVPGAPLHVPGPVSRRTSRTLSGRLPPDQEPAAVVMAALEEGDQDVLPRAPTAGGQLSTIPSRRASHAAGESGRETPDSDGFGYSGFEENNPEPILGPEQLQELRRRSIRLVGALASEPGTGAAGATVTASASPGLATGSSSGVPSGLAAGAFAAAAQGQPAGVGAGGAGGLEAAAAPSAAAAAPARRTSRTMSGLLQVAAAVAAAAETFISHRLSGGGNGSGGGGAPAGGGRRGSGGADEVASAEGAWGRSGLAFEEPRGGSESVAGEQMFGGGGVLAARHVGDSFALPSVDSFTCPAMFQFGGGSSSSSRPGSASGSLGGSLPLPGAPKAPPPLSHLAPCKGQPAAGASVAQVLVCGAVGAAGEGEQQQHQPQQQEIGAVTESAWQSSNKGWPAGASSVPPIKANPFSDPDDFGAFVGGPLGSCAPAEEATSARIGTRVADSDEELDRFAAALLAPRDAAGGRRGPAESGPPGPAAEGGAAAAAAGRPQQGGPSHAPGRAVGGSVSIHEITPASDSDGEGPSTGRAPAAVFPSASALLAQRQGSSGGGGSGGRSSGASSSGDADASPHDVPSERDPLFSVRSGAALDIPAARLGPFSAFVATSAAAARAASPSSAPLHGAEAPGLVRRAGSARQLASPAGDRAQQRQRAPGAEAGGSETLLGVLPAGGGFPGDGAADEDDAAPLVTHGLEEEGAHHISDVYSRRSTGEVHLSPEGARNQAARVVLDALCANAAAWYDAAAFALLAAQVGEAMMPPGATAGRRLVAAFALLAAGLFLRPAGAVLWPVVSANYGRGAVIVGAAALSGLPGALIGSMPNYDQAGYVGIAVIAIMRLLQGLSLGAEVAGPAAYLSEHSRSLRGAPLLRTSVVPATAALGVLAACSVCLFVSWALERRSLSAWGWRVPLVFSLAVNTSQAALRLWALQDPEEFMSGAEMADRWGDSLGPALRNGWRRILLAAMLGALPAASFYLLAAALPAYLSEMTSMAPHVALTLHTANVAALAATCMACGWLAEDPSGRARVLLGSCLAVAVLAYPLWMLIGTGLPAAAWFGQLVLVVATGLVQGGAVEGAVMAMPKGVRATSFAVAQAIAAATAGALAPLIAAAWACSTGNAAAPAFVMIAAALVSAAALVMTGRGQQDGD